MISSKKISVLAIGAHPDDIEFGCAGTLSRFVQNGDDVYMLIMTDGSMGGDPELRKHEQLRSANFLGIKEVFWGNFKDTRLPFYENVIPVIEKVVQKVKPTFVFCHSGNDTHQDHRHVTTSTVAASRHVKNLLFFEGPTSVNFQPNVFVDMENCMEMKFASLACHTTQVMRTNISGQSIVELARATATFRGTLCHLSAVEAFHSHRMLFLLK